MVYRVKHGSILIASGSRAEAFALAAEVSRLFAGILHIEKSGGGIVRRYVNGKAMPSMKKARCAVQYLRYCTEA